MTRFLLAAAAAVLSMSAYAQWTVPDQSADRVERNASRASAVDPTGDNFNPGPDLTGITASTDGADLILGLTFAGTIVSPDQGGGGNEVIGFIDIDLDQSDATGVIGGNVDVFCPTSPVDFGADVVVNLGSYDPMTGTVVIDDFGSQIGTAPITYTSNSLTVRVPLSILGDDGIADVATVIGNIPAPTDCAPDGAVLTSDFGAIGGQPVPALSMIGLLLLAGLVVLASILAVRARAS